MSNSLTPEKLILRLLDKVETDHDTTRDLIHELFSIITEQLKTEDRMALHGFGTFKRIFVDETTGHNPQTGEPLTIPAHYRIKFSPAAAMADRINKEFRDLKPVILTEEIHEGLLAKALRYEHIFQQEKYKQSSQQTTMVHGTAALSPAAEFARAPEPELEPVTVPESEARALAEAISAETEPDDPADSSSRWKKNRRFVYTAAALMAIALLLGGIYHNSRRDVPTAEPVEIKTVKISQTVQPPMPDLQEKPEINTAIPPPVIEKEENIQKTPPPPLPEEQQPGKPEPYRIASGDSFSVIARSVWGNIHLWPYIYDSNKENYPDPDILRPGDNILIPQKPDPVTQIDKIESSILSAYRRYRSLIEEQQNSPRNAMRVISSRYVLAGGERLSPSFLDRYKDKIRPEDIRRVKDELLR